MPSARTTASVSSSAPPSQPERFSVIARGSIVAALLATPLEAALAGAWRRIDGACKTALAVGVVVSVLAFGFEMTNLTLHHDDVAQIFIQDTILGHYLGRFGVGWLHYVTQNHYFMPFLQMAEGIALMSAYGVLVGWFWGLRRATDLGLIAALVCVFPYVAQIYQFNTCMATYPLAHLLAAAAVVLSVRARPIPMVIAALLFVAAMSIYQAVMANAATIFVVWLLSRHLFGGSRAALYSRESIRATTGVLVSVIAAGVAYLAIVSAMHIEYDAYQSAESAFSLREGMNLKLALPEIWSGTRSFFLWPERYLPDYVKLPQTAIVFCAMLPCVWLPRTVIGKAAALLLIVLALFTPRILQLLHPTGAYPARTLTAYAVVVAGALTIIIRSSGVAIRNAAIASGAFLVAGYLVQCNWISTVNYLNTTAHFVTLTEVLARLRSLPDTSWDGKTIAVVGAYRMPAAYPFLQHEAVASSFLDAQHMDRMARLMRDQAIFIPAEKIPPSVLAYAQHHPPWPDPASVTVLDGMGVVVFARE